MFHGTTLWRTESNCHADALQLPFWSCTRSVRLCSPAESHAVTFEVLPSKPSRSDFHSQATMGPLLPRPSSRTGSVSQAGLGATASMCACGSLAAALESSSSSPAATSRHLNGAQALLPSI